MESQLIIEPLTPADYDSVSALWRATPGLGEVETERQFNAFLERNPNLSPAARCDGRLAGAMFSGHDGRRGYLSHLAVDAAFRRRGVAKALIAWALERLQAAPVTRVSVHVYVENEEAVDFWRRVGWRERSDLQVLAFDFPRDQRNSS